LRTQAIMPTDKTIDPFWDNRFPKEAIRTIIFRENTMFNLKAYLTPPYPKEVHPMNPQIEELRAEQEQIQQEIEQIEHQQVLIENRIAYLKGAERRKRAHRLITKGAAVESIVPAVKDMDKVDFYELMEKVLTHPAIIPLLPGGSEDGTVPLSSDADQAQ